MTRIVVWLIAAVDLYLGIRCLLNAIGVLQTGKYGQATTVIFAILFLGLGALALYFLHARHDNKLALLTAIGPWALALAVLFVTMMTSRYP